MISITKKFNLGKQQLSNDAIFSTGNTQKIIKHNYLSEFSIKNKESLDKLFKKDNKEKEIHKDKETKTKPEITKLKLPINFNDLLPTVNSNRVSLPKETKIQNYTALIEGSSTMRNQTEMFLSSLNTEVEGLSLAPTPKAHTTFIKNNTTKNIGIKTKNIQFNSKQNNSNTNNTTSLTSRINLNSGLQGLGSTTHNQLSQVTKPKAILKVTPAEKMIISNRKPDAGFNAIVTGTKLSTTTPKENKISMIKTFTNTKLKLAKENLKISPDAFYDISAKGTIDRTPLNSSNKFTIKQMANPKMEKLVFKK